MDLPDYALRLLGALPEAAIFASAKGAILATNGAAREALGVRANAPCPALFELVHDDAEHVSRALRAWGRSTEPLPGTFVPNNGAEATVFSAKGSVVFPAREGQAAVLLVRFWPRTEDNPFVLLNQKITQLNDEAARRANVEAALRRSEAALRERALEAEALNRAKDEFLAMVSHELRTPLNAIVGWASLLRTRVQDPEVKKALDVIHRNAISQATVIEDILDVSRVVTGKLRLEMKPCDPTTIIEEALEVVRPSAAAKGIDLSFDHPGEAGLLVADPDRLRQVAWNLLSNAVKFTEKGGSVRASTCRKESQFIVAVTDTGRGIEPSFLPFMFDRFTQADTSSTRRAGGLGLGLALVRHIVEAHGGVVEARSAGPGAGAVFTVTIPIREALPLGPAPSRETGGALDGWQTEPTSLDGVRILLLEDEPDARELLSLVLEQAGGEVQATASASEAFQALGRFKPHVLISDIGMPEEDGYTFISRVRALDAREGGACPAIALTAYTRTEDRKKALAAGFTVHLEKPLRSAALVSVVANLLREG